MTAHYWQEGDPYTLIASCTKEQAAALIDFDHHRVVVNGRWAILLTYHWMGADATQPFIARAVLHPAPTHVARAAQIRTIIQKHQPAPEHIQPVIDLLTFTPE